MSARTFAFATFRLPFAVCRRRKYVHLINTRQSAHFISLRFAFSLFARREGGQAWQEGCWGRHLPLRQPHNTFRHRWISFAVRNLRKPNNILQLNIIALDARGIGSPLIGIYHSREGEQKGRGSNLAKCLPIYMYDNWSRVRVSSFIHLMAFHFDWWLTTRWRQCANIY